MDHYGIEWIHRTRLFLKDANADMGRFVEHPPAGRRVDLVFEHDGCRIYRYRRSVDAAAQAPS